MMKGYADAGMKVFKLLDYGGMAGSRFGENSAAKVRKAEDELLRMCGDIA
ncbi:MAG: hypothetical protein AB7F98_01740 [Novosphingobium sp.]